jgi:Putative beta-barrel porin-2, OmpL-like. bbp2
MTRRRSMFSVSFQIGLLTATGPATGPARADEGQGAGAGQEGAEGKESQDGQDGQATITAGALAPRISGFVDVTYNYNTRDPVMGVTPYHTYTARHDTLLLNAAHLALTGSSPSISYAVEVDVGSDAAVNSADDDVDLQEAYVAYVSPVKLGLKAGKFVTYQGIEVIESGANPTISRGFLFGLAEPFTHAGAVVTYQFLPSLDAALGVVNGWDVVVDNNHGKTVVAKVGYTGDGRLLTVSGYAGPEQADNDDSWRFSGDATGMVKIGPVDVWGQVNAGSEDDAAMDGGTARWIGAGLQPLWHVLEGLAIGGRAEVFSDRDGARTGSEQTLYNVSVAPAFTLTAGLVLRGEVRVDWSSDPVFADEDDTFRNQVVALTEAIYSF